MDQSRATDKLAIRQGGVSIKAGSLRGSGLSPLSRILWGAGGDAHLG
jgi:hypothetical protein